MNQLYSYVIGTVRQTVPRLLQTEFYKWWRTIGSGRSMTIKFFPLDPQEQRVSGAVTEDKKEKLLLQTKFKCTKVHVKCKSQHSFLGLFLFYFLIAECLRFMCSIFFP